VLLCPHSVASGLGFVDDATQFVNTLRTMFRVEYAARPDGARIAFGRIGRGPVLLMPPAQMSQLDWWGKAPGSEAFLTALAQHRTLVTYDRHGFGLSHRERTDFSNEDDMMDMDAVVAALRCSHLDLLGISGGTVLAILYAYQCPEVTDRIVIYGGGTGRLTSERRARLRALDDLMSADYELYLRTMMMSLYPGGADPQTVQAFLEINRKAATLEMQRSMTQARLSSARPDLDSILPALQVPTLVLHRRGDQAAPFEHGQEIASRIGGARFVPLEGDSHLPWAGDWRSVAQPIVDFLTEDEEYKDEAQSVLTDRQIEVLRLLAVGKSNPQIAHELMISRNTVARHVSNILATTGAANRTEASVYAHVHRLI
jgi:pimeloyl-ACP methyl ester carboxylesterase/DNA-binding CsgD family transcriptional regulator